MVLTRFLFGAALLRGLGAEVSGRAQVPGHGGLLLAGNHRSFLDHFLLGAASPRPARFLGKASLAGGLGGRFNLAVGMIPVERGHADRRALEAVVCSLRAGQVVALFPKGTRSPTGRLHRFRSGLARAAAAAGAPVVPVGLIGTAVVWPLGDSLPRWAPDAAPVVRFGALVPAPAADPIARRTFTAVVRERVAALCEQPLADCYAPVTDQGSPGPA